MGVQQRASSRLLRAVFECNRGKKGKDSRQPVDAKPIRSKKVDCPFQLELKVDAARNDTVVITERHGHYIHKPGVSEDVPSHSTVDNYWLKLGESVQAHSRQVSGGSRGLQAALGHLGAGPGEQSARERQGGPQRGPLRFDCSLA